MISEKLLFRLPSAIIADPPWEYDSPAAMVGNGGRGHVGAEKIVQVNVSRQYPTLSLAAIKALSPASTADAILFLWVTNPFLADGSGAAVCRAWGFRPVTVLTWAKIRKSDGGPSMKTGYLFRSASEHVIVAQKGKSLKPKGLPALPTWFAHERLPHSVKPDRIHDYAEALRPEGPWLEMFARREGRAGWHYWGDQILGSVDLHPPSHV